MMDSPLAVCGASEPTTVGVERVLLVNIGLGNGGLERQLLLLAKSLLPGVDVRLWTLGGGPFGDEIVRAGIPWRSRPRRARYDLTPAFDLWRTIREWRPDVVHSWHWMPTVAAIPACRALRVPLIDGSIRMGAIPDEFGRPRRCILNLCTLVVANSRAGLDAWRVGDRKGRVIYNAFDPSRLPKNADVRPRESSPATITVVMAARMTGQKDQRCVIEAARILERDAPGRFHYLLVGAGPEEAALRAASADLVDAGVLAFGQAGLEVIDVVCAADIGVLMTNPAHAEGCPNSVMEYMACALPVVCSNSGGSAELIRDGREGFVVAPRDAAGLARKIAVLGQDAGLRRTMGAAGRLRIEKDFTVARMVREYMTVYAEATLRSRPVGQ
jgi:glycosyltransferase involved in cell wall biosynthesis